MRPHSSLLVASLVTSLGASLSAQAPVARASATAAAAATGARARDEFRWVLTKSPHFRIHTLPGSWAAGRVDSLAASAESALAADLSLLGAVDYRRTISLSFVDDRDAMRRLVGMPYGGMAQLGRDSAYFVANAAVRPALRHELMHLVAYELWEVPAEPASWIVEGLATYAARGCRGRDFHAVAATLADEGRLASLRVLVEDFASVSDIVSYLEGASLVQFVRERYGMEAVRALWARGLAEGTRRFGTTPGALEAAWRDRLAAVPAGERGVDWAAIRAHGCE